jgi:hypothetical protein
MFGIAFVDLKSTFNTLKAHLKIKTFVRYKKLKAFLNVKKLKNDQNAHLIKVQKKKEILAQKLFFT